MLNCSLERKEMFMMEKKGKVFKAWPKIFAKVQARKEEREIIERRLEQAVEEANEYLKPLKPKLEKAMEKITKSLFKLSKDSYRWIITVKSYDGKLHGDVRFDNVLSDKRMYRRIGDFAILFQKQAHKITGIPLPYIVGYFDCEHEKHG